MVLTNKQKKLETKLSNPEYIFRNPVLNSPDDITDNLIQKIIDNNLDSLTINYEFTCTPPTTDSPIDSPDAFEKLLKCWDDLKCRTNPFWRANKKQPLKRIEFKVILTKNVTRLNWAFAHMKDLEYINLTDTSNIEDMSYMFMLAKNFNQSIGNWDVSKVTNMSGMFEDAESFNQPIGNWDVSNVTDMSCMFADAKAFNQPIGNWNTSNVTGMWGMFMRAKAFNQPIGNWDVSKVTDMTGMFEDAESFNQPIGDWDVSNVMQMSGMFYNALSFNQPISNWVVSQETSLSSMFKGAKSFNQDLSSWGGNEVLKRI